MNLFRSLDDVPTFYRGGAIAIGNFDGVHRGHARIISRLVKHARDLESASIVFTFDPHPVRLLRPDQAPPPLTWTNRKAELLSELGIDAIVAFPTTDQFLQLDYQSFFDVVIVNTLGARAVVEGPNFHFGRGRQGNVDTLHDLCTERGILVEIVQPLQEEEKYISSSWIRELIGAGNVAKAAQFLTRPYRLRGMVTHGASRGAQLGFPTANLDAIDTLVPGNGVYGGLAHVDGRSYQCAINIGANPTFGEGARKVEVHLLEFNESIYGQPIEVDFVDRLRDIRRFESANELTEQLTKDVAVVRSLFKQQEPQK